MTVNYILHRIILIKTGYCLVTLISDCVLEITVIVKHFRCRHGYNEPEII